MNKASRLQRKLGEFRVKVWIQPEAGVTPIVEAIDGAKKSIQILIFRFDRPEIERALAKAVERGVSVHALIAYTNRGGEKHLRDLEMRLLEAGATVARTAGDLPRYHGKMMIVDGRVLYLFAFNFTYLDMDRSRSFSVATTNQDLIKEALRLFNADSKRQVYKPRFDTFVVSPVNSRKQLAAFIKAAQKELLIYDPKVSDSEMVNLLNQRAAAGVEVRVIGKVTRKAENVQSVGPPMRLHARVILRDQQYAFVGSQSLRKLELDGRREVGIIFRDPKAVSRIRSTFDADWNAPASARRSVAEDMPVRKTAKKVAKAVAQEIPPVAPVLQRAIHQVVGRRAQLPVNTKEFEETIRDVVVKTVKETVQDAVEDAARKNGAGPK